MSIETEYRGGVIILSFYRLAVGLLIAIIASFIMFSLGLNIEKGC